VKERQFAPKTVSHELTGPRSVELRSVFRLNDAVSLQILGRDIISSERCD
jgi:hypothetical protein